MNGNKPPDPPGPSPVGDDPREQRGAGGFVPEFMRKAAVAGLGALFLTEEGLRSLAGQLKLPKEMLGLVASQAERTKDEVVRIFSEEVRRFLQSEALRDEWIRLLRGMTLEVKAEVRLVPSDEKGAAPRVNVTHMKAKAAPSRRSETKPDTEKEDE